LHYNARMIASNRQLFVAAHYPEQRWHPLARMVRPNGDPNGPYEFAYTNGAKFSYFDLPEVLRPQQGYYPGIPPILSNRLMRPSRPDYKDWLSWMDLDAGNNDPFEILARTGGQKATDYFETFPHGVRYFSVRHVEEAITALRPGDQLLTMSDFQNPHDRQAVALRANNRARQLLGYCPGYIACNFRKVLMHPSKYNLLVRVHKINPDAPLSMKLLCRMSCDWPDGFAPCTSKEFRLLESG